MATPFNYNPQPRSNTYSTAYGGVPGSINPPDPFGDLGSLYPNLSGTNAAVSSNILSQLRGELSPETRSAIMEDAARYGISSGMPGSDLSFRRGISNTAGAREALQNKGLENYLNATAGISRTQTLPPALQSEIADRNAMYSAAPVPKTAAENLQRTFERNAGMYGGGGGGGVTYSTPRGAAPSRGSSFAPSYGFGSYAAAGTRNVGNPYTGPYVSPIPSGWNFGGGGNDLWDVGAQPYDPMSAMFEPNTPIDYAGNWQYGVPATPQYGANQYDPLNPPGNYDPNWDYGQGIDYGADY